MKQHLNTLYVTTDGSYLAKSGQAVVVRIEKKERLRLPLHNLEAIVCFGRINCSPRLMAACNEFKISITFMSAYGRLLAKVVGFSSGNVLLRRTQYRYADDPARSLDCAKNFILAKIANCRTVLLRAAREANETEQAERLKKTATRLVSNLNAAREAENINVLRGIEGEGAALYFSRFNDLITKNSHGFKFEKRTRRPPLDPINAVLSFVYSLLSHDLRSACETVGLDAAVGYLHRDRPGRPSLALDLMEEFRPFLADRLTCTLFNRGQLTPGCFDHKENGAVLLNEAGRKTVLVALQERKQEVITHPFLNEKTTVGLLMLLQAQLFARWLRGDLDTYPPFIAK